MDIWVIWAKWWAVWCNGILDVVTNCWKPNRFHHLMGLGGKYLLKHSLKSCHWSTSEDAFNVVKAAAEAFYAATLCLYNRWWNILEQYTMCGYALVMWPWSKTIALFVFLQKHHIPAFKKLNFLSFWAVLQPFYFTPPTAVFDLPHCLLWRKALLSDWNLKNSVCERVISLTTDCSESVLHD